MKALPIFAILLLSAVAIGKHIQVAKLTTLTLEQSQAIKELMAADARLKASDDQLQAAIAECGRLTREAMMRYDAMEKECQNRHSASLLLGRAARIDLVAGHPRVF